MTLFLTCHGLSKAHGSRQLFKNISFGIFKGDKIGLIGPNGSGKSTLLKIISAIEKPDDGSVSYRKSLKIGYVPQNSVYTDHSIIDVLISSFDPDMKIPLHEKEVESRILLSKLGFKDEQQSANTLSGGWKKRLDLAKALINSPDLLLLDEPTNHLDLEGILWLENFLKNEPLTFIVTSHDRYFLQNVSSKVMELHSIYPDGIFAVDGDYVNFLERKEEFIHQQKQMERALASKVRNEVEWLRQSPKARTTKSTARVQEAERLIGELSSVKNRNKQPKAKLEFEGSERQTRKLLVVKNLEKTIGNKKLISGLDLTFSPGMRLGIVGTNGSGKTTLLRLLAGELTADKGTIKFADDLRIVYFDQYRQKLNPEDTLKRALSPNSDTVVYRGQSIHVNSWAKRFLFTPERLDMPIKQLSGGERARIGIARLMLEPADILLLDEPTNDLDIPTLETLEESLMEFPGAIALITHDRALLDRLATCVIGLGVPGKMPLLADYRQWELFLKEETAVAEEKLVEKKVEKPEATPPKGTKMSFKEKKELEQMEESIVVAEKKIAELEEMLQECTNQNKLQEMQQICQKLDEAHKHLDNLFHRWQELEAKCRNTT